MYAACGACHGANGGGGVGLETERTNRRVYRGQTGTSIETVRKLDHKQYDVGSGGRIV